MACVLCIATWSLNAHQIWSLSAEAFLSYSLAAIFDTGLQSQRVSSVSDSDSDSSLTISTPTTTPTPLRLRPNKSYSILKKEQYDVANFLISLLIVYKSVIQHPWAPPPGGIEDGGTPPSIRNSRGLFTRNNEF